MKYEIVVKTKDKWNAGTDCTAHIQLHSNSQKSDVIRISSWIYRDGTETLTMDANFNGEPVTAVTLYLECHVSDNEWDPEFVIVKDLSNNISYKADFSHAKLYTHKPAFKVTTTIYEAKKKPPVDDETITTFKNYMKELLEKLGNNFTNPIVVAQAFLDLIMKHNTITQKRGGYTPVTFKPNFMSIGSFTGVNIIALTGWETGAIYTIKDGVISFPREEKGYDTWFGGWDLGIEVNTGMTIAFFDVPGIDSLREWAYSHGTSFSLGEVGSVGLSLSALWSGKGRPKKDVRSIGLQLGVFLGAGFSMPVSAFETWEYTWFK